MQRSSTASSTLAALFVVAGCARSTPHPGVASATCTTVSSCRASDGSRVAVVGVYRFFPESPAAAASPRAVRIELDDGPGPFLDPYWSERAIRPPDEVQAHLGKRVRVVGVYRSVMPRNPTDPPQASAMGGPCIEVETIELAP